MSHRGEGGTMGVADAVAMVHATDKRGPKQIRKGDLE
jgi:hypothetical protein